MAVQPQARSAEIIRKIVARAQIELPTEEAATVAEFIGQYYAWVSIDDLVERELIDLAGAALAHWQLGRKRPGGRAMVRVYNPHFEKHGWQSGHTIVEIVADDMPFLVDSVSMALNRKGPAIHLIIHPVIATERDHSGLLQSVGAGDPPLQSQRESFMHFQIDRQTDPAQLENLRQDIERVLTACKLATGDWQAMREQTLAVVSELEQEQHPASINELEEIKALLRWLADDHFTYLGYCCYYRDPNASTPALQLDHNSCLGLLRDPKSHGLDYAGFMPTGLDQYACSFEYYVITKANARAPIHRSVYMDMLGVKRFDEAGRYTGEHIIVGLLTSAAYSRHPRDIPMLREKVERLIAQSGLPPQSHAAKALLNVVETYPRDALLQISQRQLFQTAMGILDLQERQRTRLFVRRDRYNRFFSCLVYVPRERYNRELRLRIQNVLMDALNGVQVEFNTHFSESILARLQFIVRCEPGTAPEFDVPALEQRIIEASRTWQDELKEALLDRYGEEQGIELYIEYGEAFNASYRESYSARTAAFDIEHIETVRRTGELEMNFFRPLVDTSGGVRLKLFSSRRQISPSDALPLIEKMGLRVIAEQSAKIKPAAGDRVWIHEFSLVHADSIDINPDQVGELFQDALAQVWRGGMENDGFNRLVLRAGLHWREVTLLRALCKYLRQIRIPFSQAYMEQSLDSNANIAALLVALFKIRFDPKQEKRRDQQQQQLAQTIEQRLDAVESLDQDRILRSFLNVILATLRTNFYQQTPHGEPKAYLSFKFDPGHIANMPLPRPKYEIFVYSPRTEAIHLRGGTVARGGLRWSDRLEDFRTEVLGLMKAQMVKNAVIVPLGSKGGFVVKRPPVAGDREALQQEVIDCYKIFIRGMLDITDNLKQGEVIAPTAVVRHDGDDPYLVVAADKGTATFSDIANGVSVDYGFWLDDAFASGGSVGYDHKKMGITARGAWESVKRHFRELGRDTQTQPFTVVGIGDMSGDVFGNGMLLSPCIRLVAAFNHQHIFVDPEPVPETSFQERQRLFALPRSTWQDYDTALISKGGGIFSRNAKSIHLTPEMQQALATQAIRTTPNELIQIILKSRVDLLWNGGIGTYVKSKQETHEQVRDRSNDAVRVDGAQLRCKVIGEGGNLGFTQLGRIEYASNGGLIYTDSIDNSAGVSCSDHEVNIKILLNQVVDDGELTVKQRNTLLANMTDEVADLVLHDNYWQTQALSAAAFASATQLDEHARFIRELEGMGRLDRELEFLPISEDIQRRLTARTGLVRPELAILLSYSKMRLYDELLGTELPDALFLKTTLHNYFPAVLQQRFPDYIARHTLRREIIATVVTNELVNRAGLSFIMRVQQEMGAASSEIARAFLAVREIFDLHPLWSDIEKEDNKVPVKAQIEMLAVVAGLLERATVWLLRYQAAPLDIAAVVGNFQAPVRKLSTSLPKPLAAANRLNLNKRTRYFVGLGVPSELAARVARVVPLSSAFDIVEVAKHCERDIEATAGVYFALGHKLELQWLRDQVAELSVINQWHTLARSSLRTGLHRLQRQLTLQAIDAQARNARSKRIVDAWAEKNAHELERYIRMVNELKTAGGSDFAMLSVAVSELESLVRKLAN